jgi:hypothetical protein
MPNIIDIICPALAKCPSFVANNAVDDVAATVPVAPHYAGNSAGKSIFSKGDSLQLLSIGYKLPEAFTSLVVVSPLDSLSIVVYGVTSGFIYLYPNLALSTTFVPMEGYELVTDVFFDCALATGAGPGLLKEDYKISVTLDTFLYVSMLGAPAALNGKTFYIVPYLKVLHSLPMA